MKQVKLSVRDVNAIADGRLYWKYIWRIVSGAGAVFVLFILLLALSGFGAKNNEDIIYEPLFDDLDNGNLVLTSDRQIAEYDGYYWKYVKQVDSDDNVGVMAVTCIIAIGTLVWFGVWWTKKQMEYRERARKEFGIDDKTVEIK